MAAVACACSFTLAACGGGSGGAEDAIDDFRDQIGGAATNGGDDPGDGQSGGDSSGDASPREVQPPTFLLTGGVDAPPGWVGIPPGCADDAPAGPPYFSYHVPADWNQTGSGSAGSGGGISGSGDHRYDLPDRPGLEVGVDTDSYVGTEPTDANGEPWESWDYDITSYGSDGEDSARAVYDELDPVEIDGETFDLWFLDQNQDDLVRSSEYKTRIVFADVPTGGVAGQDRQPYSATVTFGWNAEAGVLDEAVVRDVLATFRVDECTQEAMIGLYETLNGVTWSD